LARQKILGAASKSLAYENKAALEMTPIAIKSSPVWTIFKVEDGSTDMPVRCTLCNKILPQLKNSTASLIHHLHTNHASAFGSIKVQIESPNLPETYDPANPLWEIFTITDEKLAQCKRCPEFFEIQESDGTNLSEHLKCEHPGVNVIKLFLPLTTWPKSGVFIPSKHFLPCLKLARKTGVSRSGVLSVTLIWY
jgi:hypothetical protein